MNVLNVEFKVRVNNLEDVETKLSEINPVFIGEDHQTDTYFNVSHGRLKLREGNIENALIYYHRKNVADTKKSEVVLYKHQPDSSLKEILTQINGVKIIVEKKRKIYFKKNIKFHLDRVSQLGTFFEVEAIDEKGTMDVQQLQQQCDRYIDFFGLKKEDFIDRSYSDLLLEKNTGN